MSKNIVERARAMAGITHMGPCETDDVRDFAQAVIDMGEALGLCAEYYDSHCRAVQENADNLLSFHHTVGKAGVVLEKWGIT